MFRDLCETRPSGSKVLKRGGLGFSTVLGLAILGGSFIAPAHGSEFYAGKTITIISGGGGGGYDTYARLLARHIGNHIPGKPNAIVREIRGAASMAAANHIFNIAVPDGLTFGGFYRNIPLAPLMKDDAARYDLSKFTWIGSSSSYLNDTNLLIIRKEAGIRTPADLKRRVDPIWIGATGKSQTDISARVIGNVLKYNFKMSYGYPGMPNILRAIESGEMDGTFVGMSALSAVKPEWLASAGDMNHVLQFGSGAKGRNPKFPDVPHIDELVEDAQSKSMFLLLEIPFKMARPFAAPPNMPHDRTAILRAAFMAANEDPQYLSEAEKLQLDISPVSGEEIAEILAQAHAIPQDVLQRYIDLVN